PPNHVPLQFPAVASSRAPTALVPGHACSGLPSLTTAVALVVTWVDGISVCAAPSTRTVTLAGAAPAASDAGTRSNAHAAPTAAEIRRRCMSHPFPRGLCGPAVDDRSPGSRADPPAPSRPLTRGSVAALTRRGGHPRSQWRVRAGLSPASL